VSPQILGEQAKIAFANGTRLTLTVPHCWRKPQSFPNYEVLSVSELGRNLSFEPDEVLAWLVDNGLVPESEGVLIAPSSVAPRRPSQASPSPARPADQTLPG
jgi:hypothetical protein